MDLLSILEQNPDLNWKTLIGNISIESETDSSLVSISSDPVEESSKENASENTDSEDDDDDLTSFTL